MGRVFNVLALTQTWKLPYELNAIAESQRRQAICFVCSLSDFFHADADHWRRDAWRIIKDCKNVNFMLLTKRPERIVECLPADWRNGQGYPNAWLGTTCGVRSSYARIDILRAIPCSLRFLSIEPLMEGVADIDLTGIGWVAAGGMSGVLHKTHQMRMAWAAEVHDLCKKQNVPFLFKQASNIHTERGINALSLFLAEREGREVEPATVPLIREYPATELPLLPFTEHGKRFTTVDWAKYTKAEDRVQGTRPTAPCSVLPPCVVVPITVLSAGDSPAIESGEPVQTLRRRHERKDERTPERSPAPRPKKPMRTAGRKRAAVPMNIADTVRAVQAVYPDAIFEWPSQRCSISEYPGGPEVSARFANTTLAWIDAARTIENQLGLGVARKTNGTRNAKSQPEKASAA
jgi:protein gp37